MLQADPCDGSLSWPTSSMTHVDATGFKHVTVGMHSLNIAFTRGCDHRLFQHDTCSLHQETPSITPARDRGVVWGVLVRMRRASHTEVQDHVSYALHSPDH